MDEGSNRKKIGMDERSDESRNEQEKGREIKHVNKRERERD